MNKSLHISLNYKHQSYSCNSLLPGAIENFKQKYGSCLVLFFQMDYFKEACRNILDSLHNVHMF